MNVVELRRKRIAWSVAAVVITALVAAGALGRTTDPSQNVAQTVPAAAPMTAISALASLSSPSLTPSPVLSTVRSAASPAQPANPLLAPPPAIAVVRTALAAQAAETTLQKLRVAGRAPKTGYSRAQFGQAWSDDVAVAGGHNGCDTRNDILRRDLRQIIVRAGSNGCKVTSGTLIDPYTGKALVFSSGSAAAVQIDHVVALSNAWQTGAAALSPQQRQELANDPLNLQATAGAVNQAKGDGDAATWLPPNKSYRCTYVARQVAVKARHRLWVTAAERQAISTVLTGCGATPRQQPTPKPTPKPAATRAPAPPAQTRRTQAAPARTSTAVAPPTTSVQQLPVQTTSEPVMTTESSTEPEATTPETTPVETTPDDPDVYYENCTAAKAAGVTPLHRGDPGYRAGLDRDDDGDACES